MFEHAPWASEARKQEARLMDRTANAVRRARHRAKTPRTARALADDMLQLATGSGHATRDALHHFGWTADELDRLGTDAARIARQSFPDLAGV
jgi:hypothetical protein